MRKRISSVTSSSDTDHSAVFIPDDLRIVLRVIGNSILKGHLALSDALRKRYDEQYPLVRSLADIFIEHVGGCPAHASPVDLTDRFLFLLLRQSYLFQEYTDYIVHLEKALQQLDDCLNSASTHKRRYSDVSLHGDAALGATLRALNETANDKGETGLSIALSKPFQRLLKYPLLFQNLLFNTDATLTEYDACMNLLEEVDGIVRSMEDEKANKDVSEKTRDALARIEGLDRDSTLSLPRLSRTFIDEHPAPEPDQQTKLMSENPNRRSLRRLSDLMRGHSQSPTEIWEVIFSDVTLLCQKVGSTALPIYSRTAKVRDEGRMPSRRSSIRMGRRSRQIVTRNLYQFLSVKEWHTEKQAAEDGGFSNLERQQSTSGDSSMSRPESIKEEDSDGSESSSDDSEQMNFILGETAPRRRHSTMHTTATSENVVEKPLQIPASSTTKPLAAGRTSRVSSRIASKPGNMPSRARSPTEMMNSQAKFGTRLRNPELSATTSRDRAASSMARTIVSSAQVPGSTGPRQPCRTGQRAVSTPVVSAMRGSTRPPPSSVRGTSRRAQQVPKI
ncbi:hypothetical protein QFC20_003001 [Naganishia adeliensis]|uniref:Uncharacterized protein n=1 Tax=Naganishia adeliensis TaxID=92952 RepID=A0ACC2WG07_9TREE|nr:hypothetical protein QFC20_003001 [Naganishia adeliensis]